MNNKEVAKLATKALLYEVSISPKAGLVSRLSNGSHRDMDFYTFIIAYFYKFVYPNILSS